MSTIKAKIDNTRHVNLSIHIATEVDPNCLFETVEVPNAINEYMLTIEFSSHEKSNQFFERLKDYGVGTTFETI